jgi:hypothetical protein
MSAAAVATTATAVGKAAASAGALEQQAAAGQPQGSAFDVWSHTGQGLARRAESPKQAVLDSTPAGAVVGAARGLTSEWSSTSAEGASDAFQSQASSIAEQFSNFFSDDPKKNPEGVLANIGAAFGLLVSVEQMLSIGFGMIPFPAMPALRILDTDVGLPHAHAHPPNLIPPNPVPIPLPSTGPVIPIPLFSGASKTQINAMPAARCGDMGLGVWCGGYVPMFEVFLGSATVWIEGSRAARTAVDITNHCIFSARPGDPPIGLFVGTTVTGSSNVVIGGVPLPSLVALGMGAAFRGLGKVLGKAWSKARPKKIVRNSPDATGVHRIDQLRGAASAHFPPQVTENVLRIMRDLRRSGARIDIPGGINARELAALTAATGDEFAVVWSRRHKELQLVRGTADKVSTTADDICLVHTHPSSADDYVSAISEGDLDAARYARDTQGWSHGEATVTADGQVHHFNGDGVVDQPALTPIGPDGHIGGLYTSPDGAPMFADPSLL